MIVRSAQKRRIKNVHDSADCFDFVVDRCTADLAIQQRLGILSERRFGFDCINHCNFSVDRPSLVANEVGCIITHRVFKALRTLRFRVLTVEP